MTKSKFERVEAQDIGSGSYGKVSKVRRKWDQKVCETFFSVCRVVLTWVCNKLFACKTIPCQSDFENDPRDPASEDKKKARGELKILQGLKHPNIVGYVDGEEWLQRETRLYMEFCEGGDLGNFIRQTKRKKFDDPTPLTPTKLERLMT